jgi:hypothetical protein
MPPIVHAQGHKPWFSNSRNSVAADLSPYFAACAPFVSDIPGGGELADQPRKLVSKLCNAIFLGHPSLRGLPASLLYDIRSTLAFRSRIRKAMS